MKVRRCAFAADHPVALVVALLVAAASLTAGQFALPPGQDRSSELFGGHRVTAGEVLVAFRQPPDLQRLRVDLDAASDATVGDGRIWRIRSRSKNVGALLNALASRRDILYAEPNYILYTTREPDDPRFPELWGLRNIGQTINGVPGTPGVDISAVPAWDVAIGARTNVVGVVDTGIDYVHPDLSGNVWSAPAPFTVTIGGQAITCAAGTHGFNAINRTCDPLDDHFHGTHVSGTIGAVGNNGVGVAGVNWLANMMGLKFLSASGSGSLADALNAIEFAIQAKTVLGAAANVRVLSNSWAGGGFSQALFDQITRANQNDMLFVAAAGNSASDNDISPTYPAGYAVPNVIAVAAIDNQDALASFSNFGATTVHLGAPGVKVLSTTPQGGYDSFSGTSMATPHVSGAAALLLSRCTLTTAAVKAAILDHVDPTGALAGRTITGGRLNVEGALTACTPTGNKAPIVSLTNPNGETLVSAPDPIPLSATASDQDGSVASVAFYAGTSLIGSVTQPPYTRTWTNVPVGNYSVTAVAVDNRGAVSTTPAATIHVLPGPSSSPFQGVEAVLPGVVEAENFNEGGEGVGYHDLTSGNSGGMYRQTDVDIVTTADGGDGFAVTSIAAGEWLAYRVFVQNSGAYTVQARVASAGIGGTFHIEVDGVDVTGSLNVPDTGGAQTWQTIGTQGVQLTAGSHIMRVVFDAKGATGPVGNLNYVRVSVAGANTPPSVTVTAPTGGATMTWPTSVVMRATAGDADGTVTQVSFYAGSTLVGTDTTAPYTATWNNPLPGNYSITAVAVDNSGASATSAAIAIQVVTPPPSTPFGGAAAAIPGVIQIENFDEGGEGIAYHDTTAGNTGGNYRTTDVDIERTSDTNGGYSIGWVAAGEWLMYTVSVATAGTYDLELRVASAGTGGALHVEIDRVAATGSIAVPSTGGWQIWNSLNVPGIPLAAGSHLVRLVMDSNGGTGFVGNMNYMRWSIPGSNAPPTVALTAPTSGSTFSAPATVSLAANASDSDGTIAQVSFYNGTSLIATDTSAPFTASWSGVPIGTYSLTAVATDNNGATATSAAVTIQVVTPPASSPYGGTAASIPGLVELERFDEGGEGIAYHDTTAGNTGMSFRSTDVDIEGTWDTGGGFDVGWIAAGEWLKYSITAASSGSYAVELRVASQGSGGTFHIEVDGVPATAALTIPSTGGWQTWSSIAASGISMTAGPHAIRVVFDTNGSSGLVGNLNSMRWSIPGSNTPPTVAITAPSNGASFIAPASITLSANASDSDGSVTQVSFYNGTTLIGTDATSPYTLSWTNVAAGSYTLTAVATDTLGASTTSSPVTVQVTVPASPTPYGGTPWAIPGLIELENFDEGGEGIAYHDTTSGNSGLSYRSTNVDIESTWDTGGGFNIGWVAAGEWLKYSVSVQTTALYSLTFRVASPSAGGTFHVEVDGVPVTGTLVIPSTGGWQTWTSLSASGISMTQGPHVIRVVFDTNGATGMVGNVNSMRWTASPGS